MCVCLHISQYIYICINIWSYIEIWCSMVAKRIQLESPGLCMKCNLNQSAAQPSKYWPPLAINQCLYAFPTLCECRLCTSSVSQSPHDHQQESKAAFMSHLGFLVAQANSGVRQSPWKWHQHCSYINSADSGAETHFPSPISLSGKTLPQTRAGLRAHRVVQAQSHYTVMG